MMKKMMDKPALAEVFAGHDAAEVISHCDKDHDDKLTKGELLSCVKGEPDAQEIKAHVDKEFAGVAKDGKVDAKELQKLIDSFEDKK